MIWKYLVYWCVVTTYQIPCPDANKVTVDEFGRKSKSMTGCLVLHTETEKVQYMQYYFNRDSAMVKFQSARKAAKNELTSIWEEGIGCVQLDSIKVSR